MTRDELEQWLISRVASVTGVPVGEIERTSTFDGLGLDSVSRLGLVGELEKRLRQRLDAEVMSDHQTIGELVDHLSEAEL